MRTILVTGATGYIGSRLVTELLARGHVVIAPERLGNHCIAEKELGGRLVRIGWGRGAVEFEAALKRACGGGRVDSVINLAGHAIVDHAAGDVDDLIEANFSSGVRAADSGVRLGARTFIQAGSFWEKGAGVACDMPNSLYAALKASLPIVLHYYLAAGLIETVVHLKLFDVYGEADPRGRLLSLLLDAQKTGTSLQMSAGTQKIDLIHVEDVVAAIAIAEEQAAIGRLAGSHTYSVNTRKPRSVREVAALVETVTGRPVPVVWDVLPARAVDTEVPWPGSDWLPGWQPSVSLSEGIRRLSQPSQSTTPHIRS